MLYEVITVWIYAAPAQPLLRYFVWALLWVNLVWNGFNLLPIWPPILRQTVQRYLDAGDPEAALTAVEYVLELSPGLLDSYNFV